MGNSIVSFLRHQGTKIVAQRARERVIQKQFNNWKRSDRLESMFFPMLLSSQGSYLNLAIDAPNGK